MLFKWKKNGKGKEYNYRNELIFEGEYVDGIKWNRKGKEYTVLHKFRNIFLPQKISWENW